MVRPAGLAVASMIVTVTVSVALVLGDPSIEGADAAPSEAESIPEHVALVYDYAAATAPCPLSFATLAGIGAVTSDHTRLGGESRLLPDGASSPTIVYERLAPTAPSGLLPDTDGGRIDGTPVADTTVGPMQFLPATWVDFGVDGNGDGIADPNNMWDAAASSANRLCAASADTDLAGALTAYFGTEKYNEWVLESIADAAAWQLAVRPQPERRAIEVVRIEPTATVVSGTGSLSESTGIISPAATEPPTLQAEATDPPLTATPSVALPSVAPPSFGASSVAPPTVAPPSFGASSVAPPTIGPPSFGASSVGTSPVGTSPFGEPDEIQVAGVEQLPSAPPGPEFIGPPSPSPSAEPPLIAPGEPSVSGDWDGDGASGVATLTIEPDRVVVRRTDAAGRPYGRVMDVSLELADPEAVGGLVVGEWDGDGIDDLALLVANADGVVATRFDRAGNVLDVGDLGVLLKGASVVVGPAPAPTLVAGDAEAWKTLAAHDGTVLDLWRVGGIIVDASLVDQTSAMLAEALADGIKLEGWGWRSHDAQIELRRAHCADVWTTPASACSPPTAIPGTSRHEYGTAIDFHSNAVSLSATSPEFLWLVDNAEQFGFFNLPSEPWHWSIDGG